MIGLMKSAAACRNSLRYDKCGQGLENGKADKVDKGRAKVFALSSVK